VLADLPIHEFIESTEVACPDVRHRLILHNADLGPELATRAFPVRPNARSVALRHIDEDFKDVPTLADWLAVCDSSRFPTPRADHVLPLSFDAVAATIAQSQDFKENDGPRAVLDLLLLPVALAGPGALSILCNAVGSSTARSILGLPRLVPGSREGQVMFDPSLVADKIIQWIYGRIPSLVDRPADDAAQGDHVTDVSTVGWSDLVLLSQSPVIAAILAPSGLPRPVQASQPGEAAKPPLLPWVMSCKAEGWP
jgi:hypothetical protein